MPTKPDARARKSSCLAWVSTQRLCHLCFGITMMLTGCRGKRKSGSRELDFLFPSCCETDVLHDLSLLVGLASCPPCPSLTEKGAGFDVCREAGRKSISTLCVLEHKPCFFFFFFSQPARCTCFTSVLLFLLQALMSLFVLASKDGWVNIMYNGLDAVAVDQQV